MIIIIITSNNSSINNNNNNNTKRSTLFILLTYHSSIYSIPKLFYILYSIFYIPYSILSQLQKLPGKLKRKNSIPVGEVPSITWRRTILPLAKPVG